MTIPANLTLEAAPYGARPVLPVVGPQGGPYDVSGPKTVTLLPSASRTTTTNTAIQQNYGYKAVKLTLNASVNPGGAQTLAATVFAFDPVSGIAVPICTVPASATPTAVYAIFPGASGAAVEGIAQTRNLQLPAQWYVTITHSGAGAWTYSLSADLLP